MESQIWLITETSNKILTEDEIQEKLYQMICATQLVKNINLLKSDIEYKIQKSSPYITPNIFYAHAKSFGVKDFCASILFLPNGKKYCLSGWSEYSENTLKKLSMLMEYLEINKETEEKKCFQ